MYRIRLHGRGGQGLKTASQLMGTALFLEGFEVQDAPRYGAERRGAPILAYVRAGAEPIQERGVISLPDLVVVTDDSLVALPSAGVMLGFSAHTAILLCSHLPAEEWRARLNLRGPVVVIPTKEGDDPLANRYIGSRCVGAACRLLGVISRARLEEALRTELAQFPAPVIEENVRLASEAFDLVAGHEGVVDEGQPFHVRDHTRTDWVTLTSEALTDATPAVWGELTSVTVRTGLWRTLRPVVEYAHCNRCNWVCSSFCPDSAICVDGDGYPHIDLYHCKGCMICVEQCPPHAIVTLPESVARQLEEEAELKEVEIP